MAIELIQAPGSEPTSNDDYYAQNNYLKCLVNKLNFNQLLITEWETLNLSQIKQGVYFQHGGSLFQTKDADVSISSGAAPTQSGRAYCKLTQSGNNLLPSWQYSLSLFSWNYVYNNFYDTSNRSLLPFIFFYTTSGNLYKYHFNRCENKFDIGSRIVIREINPIGPWDMDNIPDIFYNYSDILSTLHDNLLFNEFSERIISYTVNIVNDTNTSIKSLTEDGSIDIFSPLATKRFYFNRYTSGIFDGANYSGGGNRGYFILEYWI